MVQHKKLKNYRKIPRQIWAEYYKRFGWRMEPEFDNVFCVHYDKNIKEVYYIESNFWDAANELYNK